MYVANNVPIGLIELTSNGFEYDGSAVGTKTEVFSFTTDSGLISVLTVDLSAIAESLT